MDECGWCSSLEEGWCEGEGDVGVVGEGEGKIVSGACGEGGVWGRGGGDGRGKFDPEGVVSDEVRVAAGVMRTRGRKGIDYRGEDGGSTGVCEGGKGGWSEGGGRGGGGEEDGGLWGGGEGDIGREGEVIGVRLRQGKLGSDYRDGGGGGKANGIDDCTENEVCPELLGGEFGEALSGAQALKRAEGGERHWSSWMSVPRC